MSRSSARRVPTTARATVRSLTAEAALTFEDCGGEGHLSRASSISTARLIRRRLPPGARRELVASGHAVVLQCGGDLDDSSERVDCGGQGHLSRDCPEEKVARTDTRAWCVGGEIR